MENLNLTPNDKKLLLTIARETVYNYFKHNFVTPINEEALPDSLKIKCGAFVTLRKKDKLRGCIGRFTQNQPLFSVVQDMAIAAAFEDSRFDPLSYDELDDVVFEISVLSPMKKINSPDEIIIGKHGIYIKKGFISGTFLPQVAVEYNLSPYEFVALCCKNKLRLDENCWKKAELYVYETISFSEKEFD